MKFPKAIFIAGGESITGSAEECLKQCKALSICAIGEGEETIVELIAKIQSNEDISTVGSIVYRHNDSILKTPRRARLKNLDEIPLPAWELFPVHKYDKNKRSRDAKAPEFSLGILATRGCPYTCTFCTSPDMWGTRYYMRKPEHVIAEIEYLKEKFNVTIFDFYDLTAIIQKSWIMEFTNLLIEKELNIAWRIPAGTRSEAIDSEVAENLRKSGCYSITYAPESGSPRMLKLIHKKVKLDNILKSMKDAKKKGMAVQINIILGMPDETHLDIWKTIVFLIRCSKVGVRWINLHLFRPYPGSALFNRLQNEGSLQIEKDDYLIDSLLIIVGAKEESSYNVNISKTVYKYYFNLILFVFHSSGYFFSPLSFFKSFKNITTHNYQSRFEEALSNRYKRISSTLRLIFS